MRDSAAGPLYSIDSSSLMDWQGRFYPVDVFSGLLGRMDGLTAAGRLLAPALVREEIEKVGTMGLRTWAAANPALFISTGDVLQQAQVIQGQFPDLLDPRAEFEEADAYVIALGHACVMASWSHKRRPRPRSAALAALTTSPTCADLGIPCINLLGLMRREGWQF